MKTTCRHNDCFFKTSTDTQCGWPPCVMRSCHSKAPTDTAEKSDYPHDMKEHAVDEDGVPVYDVICTVCTSSTTDTSEKDQTNNV